MAGLASVTRHLRVRVADGGEVGGAGAGLQLGEEAVVAHASLDLGDPALGVVLVPEDDGLRGAGGLARGPDLPVPDLPPLVAGVGARAVDALHAVRALL